MNWPLRTVLLVLWFLFGLIGILPHYFLIVPSPFLSYVGPLAWLQGPIVNHHSGFPIWYIRNAIVAPNGSWTLEFDYGKLIFDLAFITISTVCLYVAIRRHRQFSIRLLFALTCMAGVCLALCQHLEGFLAVMLTVLYSLPALYCSFRGIVHHYRLCRPVALNLE